ncbi:MAG: hypothetical protein HYV99_02020 [Betaproteobacteria bacterium]|nr:hypothetical protein [Betaproteobacteria bacterium]
MALKWMGGGKADHPMADARQAQRIVAELPANDAGKALQEITEWLESLNATEGFKLDRRFENIDLLDGAAKNHQRKLAQDYLSTSRQQKFQENRLWNGINGYWKELGASYVLCIKHYESGFSGAASIKKSLPVIVARALRALTLQLKWTLLRYGPVEPRAWSEIARLYQAAEQKGIADFLKALMLSASSTDGLPPVRQEIAERAVAHFASGFLLSAAPEGCTHCFDLAGPKTPVRMFKGVAPSPTMRFFGAGAALAGLEKLMAKIREMGAIPSDVNLGGSYERDIVLDVLKHLSLQWSEKPPERNSERRKTASRITVVPGFSEILGVLDPAGNDELDFSQEQSQNVESWIVENVSEGGYGAIIPPRKSDWIKVGTLLGVQGETSKYWGIGLIRRIAADEHQQRRVGIQLLSKGAIPIRVSRSGPTSGFSAGREPQQAILLSTAPDAQGEVGVVLREGIFNGRDSLDMTVRDKSYLLMPASMVEDGEDFDWAKFKVMQRSA